MPSLNEENNLAGAVDNVLASFARLGINGELIVVNDGSTDRTGRLAEEFAQRFPNIKVIHHDRPNGIGASFWDGVEQGAGEVVTMLPGDGENDAAEILRYLPLMEQVDIVVPFVYNRGVRTFRRRLLSIVYREIIKASFGLSLNYMNGTVMYRRSIFRDIKLKCGGFFYQTELLVKTIISGYLYAEVPYALMQRGDGESKATTFKSLLRVARGYLDTMREVYLGGERPKGIVPESATARRRNELTTTAAENG